MPMTKSTLILALSAVLGACTVGPDYVRPASPEPARWEAPLPHSGNPAALADWWKQFDDPLVAELIERAERDSPTLDQALARIAQSRAGVTAARSALLPSVGLSGGRSKGGDNPVAYEQTVTRGAFDAAWEIDFFGGNRRGSEAATARLQGAEAAWHDARISLAAEVALEYVGLRACEVRLADAEVDQASRRATEKLTLTKSGAGFAAPADASLAQASAAEGATRLLAQRVECEIGVKSLVALTGLPEADLRARLQAGHGQLPAPASLGVDELPARIVSARPDVASAERSLAAASAEIGVAEAARYPRLSLLGSIGRQSQEINGVSASGRLWSFGPTLDLPIFDAGRRAANADAARARYDEALAGYKGAVRRAVREVEQSLVRLASAAEREAEAGSAARRYDEVFRAAEQRWKVGIGSQLDLEETRRLATAARSMHLGVRYDSVATWIGLYRAVGGGWSPSDEICHSGECRNPEQSTPGISP